MILDIFVGGGYKESFLCATRSGVVFQGTGTYSLGPLFEPGFHNPIQIQMYSPFRDFVMSF